jgi:hypothetical protein
MYIFDDFFDKVSYNTLENEHFAFLKALVSGKIFLNLNDYIFKKVKNLQLKLNIY